MACAVRNQSNQANKMDQPPIFPLFADPIREGVFKQSDKVCDVCGRGRGWIYTAATYGELDQPVVCPWCIHDGSAAKKGITFNDATIYPALPGTRQLSAKDRKWVEERTPGFNTWQGNHWLACCGGACVYLGEAEAADLAGRWAEAAASLFVAEADWSDEQKSKVVTSVHRGSSPAAYVFQCRECSRLKGYWDCN
jgi:uncharacterized protein CbrC (UPF0167 family)